MVGHSREDVTVQQALEGIALENKRARTDGLRDLKHVLLENRHTRRLDSLRDKDFHRIFDVLFRLIASEKSQYARAKSAITKNSCAARLTSCASAIRVTAELGLRKIKYKTLSAVISHITEVLSISYLWEPLGDDYIKTLRAVLDYPSHTEHLQKHDWKHILDLCLARLKGDEDEAENEENLGNRSYPMSASESESRASSVEPTTPRQPGKPVLSAKDNNRLLSEIVDILEIPCSCRSAAIVEEAPKLLNGLLQYLTSAAVSKAPRGALAALNAILVRTAPNSISLVQETLLRAFPIICSFWSTNSTLVKEELLVMLDLGRVMVPGFQDPVYPELLDSSVANIVEYFEKQYLGLPASQCLQSSDVILSLPDCVNPMGVRGLAPHLGTRHAEHCWVILRTVARFSVFSDRRQGQSSSPEHSDDEMDLEPPSKKHSRQSRMFDIARDAYLSSGTSKIFALQLLSILIAEENVPLEQLSFLLERLMMQMSDPNMQIASWTVITISSIAGCHHATSEDLNSIWCKAWELLPRTISSPGTAITGYHLMATILHRNLVNTSVANGIINSMPNSMDFIGPARLTDSSILLWKVVMNSRRRSNVSQSRAVTSQICQWLRSTWTVKTFKTEQFASSYRLTELLSLLMSCVNRSFEFPNTPFAAPLSRIAQSWFHRHWDTELVSYLLLSQEQLAHDIGTGMKESRSVQVDDSSSQLVLELLQDKLNAFAELWTSLSTETPQDVKGGVIQTMTIICVVSSIFLEVVSPPLQSAYYKLKSQIEELWADMCAFFSSQEHVNAALDALAPLVLSIKHPLDAGHPILKGLKPPTQQLLDVSQKVCISAFKDEVSADDAIEINTSEITPISKFDREDVSFPAFCDVTSVRTATVVHLTVFLHAVSPVETNHQSIIPLFDYLLSLKEEELLVYKFYLSSLIESQPSMSLSDANEVFISLTEKCLNGYNLQRCEGASSICTSLISSFAYLWVPNVDHEIHEAATSLFDWFTETIVGKDIASTRTLVRVATFIEEVMTINPDFSRGPSKPSPRTHFFKIMRQGDLSVKFKLAKLIPSIFARFPASEHDVIFSDVLDNLPNDPEWKEGIAFRLMLLGNLASRWHTLLRRAVYHIFEIPGLVPNSSLYAKACFQKISASLGLEEPKEIFRLLGSQLIYTWLETQSIGTIPFSVFGYFSLQDLLLEVQDEVVAQVVLRGNDQEMQELSQALETPFLELLETSFARVEAYSISRDISIPQGQTPCPPGAEKRLLKLIGEARFVKLIMNHFADIIAVIFQCIDQPELISRALVKWPSLSSVHSVWKNLEEKSPSPTLLPPGQQPCFRAKYLFDQLSYVAGHLGRTLNNLWIPALVGYVARSLIDTLHPSLKQIRSAAIVRKLRILICMAGPTVFEPYIAQILLSFLVPLLTDTHCSSDAIGAVWYIYENRTGAGPDVCAEIQLALTVSISINNLVASNQKQLSPDRTLAADYSKASQFADWFHRFLGSWVVHPEHMDRQQKFQDMVSIACLLPTLSRSRKETTQGTLLLYIIEEGGSRTLKVHRNGIKIFLSCFNEKVDPTRKFQSSVLDSDAEAVKYAESLVDCYRCGIAETGYQLWIARALGRSYAAAGKPDIKSLLDDQMSVSLEVDPKRPHLNSTLGIMENLCLNAMSDDFKTASLAQHTCQAIATKFDSDEALSEGKNITPPHLIKYFVWRPYTCPKLHLTQLELKGLDLSIHWNPNIPAREWARNIAMALCTKRLEAPVLGDLPKILYHVPSFAEETLPYIFHDVLLAEHRDSLGIVKQEISDVFREAFASDSFYIIPHLRLIIQTILYLRTREFPKEETPEARDHWLDIDYLSAASAAIKCQMYETALLFVEIHCSQPSGKSRRQSAKCLPLPLDTLSSIFDRIGDLDLTYGIDREPSLEAILERLQHEDSGMKTLSFQSALYNAELRLSQAPSDDDSLAVIKALNQSSLQCIASSMSSSTDSFKAKTEASETMLSTELDLQRWDLPVDNSNPSSTGSILKVLQSLSVTEDKPQMMEILDSSYLNVLCNIFDRQSTESMRDKMQALAVFTEIDEIMSCASSDALRKEWDKIASRNDWLRLENFNDIHRLLQCREASFASINRRPNLQSLLNVNAQHAQLLEFKAARETFRLSKEHEGTHLETTLKSAVLLYKLVKPCAQLGINVDAAAKHDLATALWDQGEKVAAIGMLRQLIGEDNLANQAIPIRKAEIFTLLGHYVAETKLEKPEAIINNYLLPSVKELKGDTKGSVPGRVYHEFAVFCDKQFQESAKPFQHIEVIRSRKLQEIDRNREMALSATPSEKKRLQNEREKARKWLQLDDHEWKRLLNHRASLLTRCLVNYTLSLAACDDFKNDVIRFFTIWMDNSDKEIANKAVSSGLDKVPSRRFAPLTNQLLSRLADENNNFQTPLSSLLFRICVDHPYHSMNHLFMTCRTKTSDDEITNARFNAANVLSQRLFNDNRTRRTWTRMNNFNSHYVHFANAFTKDEQRKRPISGATLRLDQYGAPLITDIETTKLPPPTLNIPLRHDCNYEHIPHIAKYSRDFTIAGGISAPKIVDVTTSDGRRHKQLFKAGNDDLRQDAVMEQVFEQVSDLLRDHRSTRQRNLGIRTYKVVPLTPNAGVIEFVKDTMPLNDYLMPAHRKYFPTDYKFTTCRDNMYNVQTRPNEERIQVYRRITSNFNPVLRFFFTEQFKEPDVWFSRRIAYTRSTAAISMLGYILGLGDRHLNNILLDKTTGEVVHIDLGVAFEQGRVLPIPEVVPFRLTRDIVDGMGITKTEGVFRRCCEFTLDVLRQECYSVMTILDVLRYDPLCCWTISRVRVKKMQDTQRPTGSPVQKKNDANKSSDADRALAIVQEKLTTNSIAATVNELIQQSTDERNLAVLYCGWAPFA